ncbi:hypothetical protein GCM10025738_06070 [Microbacterium fluvii]
MSATPTPTPSATTPTPTPTPTPTDSGAPQAEGTCQNTATPEFLAMMDDREWTVKNTAGQESGAKPFAVFPDGSPDGWISCRWAADPDAATDNIIDLAWAPFTVDQIDGATAALDAEGYSHKDGGAGGILYVYDDESGGPEGDAYLFTQYDVRWAMTEEELGFIQAPAAQ